MPKTTASKTQLGLMATPQLIYGAMTGKTETVATTYKTLSEATKPYNFSEASRTYTFTDDK